MRCVEAERGPFAMCSSDGNDYAGCIDVNARCLNANISREPERARFPLLHKISVRALIIKYEFLLLPKFNVQV